MQTGGNAGSQRKAEVIFEPSTPKEVRDTATSVFRQRPLYFGLRDDAPIQPEYKPSSGATVITGVLADDAKIADTEDAILSIMDDLEKGARAPEIIRKLEQQKQ